MLSSTSNHVSLSISVRLFIRCVLYTSNQSCDHFSFLWSGHHYHRWKQVYSRCGVKSISHGSTPAGRPVPEWAVCGRCKCGAQSQSWAWSPTHTVHNVEHFSYISLRSSLTTCLSVGVCALCVCTYRHLHFKLILVKLKKDVWDCPLEECCGSQYQHQLQVTWERALQHTNTQNTKKTSSSQIKPNPAC